MQEMRLCHSNRLPRFLDDSKAPFIISIHTVYTANLGTHNLTKLELDPVFLAADVAKSKSTYYGVASAGFLGVFFYAAVGLVDIYI